MKATAFLDPWKHIAEKGAQNTKENLVIDYWTMGLTVYMHEYAIEVTPAVWRICRKPFSTRKLQALRLDHQSEWGW